MTPFGAHPAPPAERSTSGRAVSVPGSPVFGEVADPTSEMVVDASVTVVVPVFNAMAHLPLTVPAIVSALRWVPHGELVFVDNGSTDGSFEYISALEINARVYRRERGRVSELRNVGAHAGSGDYLSFIDSDCLIAEDYFKQAVSVIRSTGATATGCEVTAPSRGHWIEATWHFLHYVGRDREVHYLNSGNFFISRESFLAIGGFDEKLITGEDAEISRRLLENGYRIYESTRVGAVHLGNPKSIRQFYRRTVWHALGMFGTVGWKRIDKPTTMMTAHLLASVAGIPAVLTLSSVGQGLLLLIVLQLLVPASTVAFRCYQTRRFGRILQGTFLYWLYYWARIQGLALILAHRSGEYRK